MARPRFTYLLALAVTTLRLFVKAQDGLECDWTGASLVGQLESLGLSADPNATWTGELQTVPLGDVTFPYYMFGGDSAGSGQTIVMVNGYGTTIAEWGPILPQLLAREHRVLMFDNAGQGFSTDTSTQHLTVREMADITMEGLRAAGVVAPDSKPVVLGWSMGGMVALSMAQQYGSELAGLVLADTTAGGPEMVFPDEATIEALTCCDGQNVTSVMFDLSTPAGQAGACTFLTGAIFMSEALGEGEPNPVVSADQANATYEFEMSTGVYDALPSMDLPVLILQGEEDLIVPQQNALIMFARLPQATLELYPEAGHGLWAQDIVDFAEDVNAFMKNLPPAGGMPAPAPAPSLPPSNAAVPSGRLCMWVAAAALAAMAGTLL